MLTLNKMISVLLCLIFYGISQHLLAIEKNTNSEIDKELTEYYLSRVDKEYTGYVENYSLYMFNNKFLFNDKVNCFFYIDKGVISGDFKCYNKKDLVYYGEYKNNLLDGFEVVFDITGKKVLSSFYWSNGKKQGVKVSLTQNGFDNVYEFFDENGLWIKKIFNYFETNRTKNIGANFSIIRVVNKHKETARLYPYIYVKHGDEIRYNHEGKIITRIVWVYGQTTNAEVYSYDLNNNRIVLYKGRTIPYEKPFPDLISDDFDYSVSLNYHRSDIRTLSDLDYILLGKLAKDGVEKVYLDGEYYGQVLWVNGHPRSYAMKLKKEDGNYIFLFNDRRFSVNYCIMPFFNMNYYNFYKRSTVVTDYNIGESCANSLKLNNYKVYTEAELENYNIYDDFSNHIHRVYNRKINRVFFNK